MDKEKRTTCLVNSIKGGQPFYGGIGYRGGKICLGILRKTEKKNDE